MHNGYTNAGLGDSIICDLWAWCRKNKQQSQKYLETGKMSCLAVSFLYFMNLIYEIQTGFAPPPETTVASSPPETTAAPQEPESSGLTTEHKIIIGVCVSVFALAVIAVVAVKMYQQKKRRNQTSETQAK
eukprot:XP_011417840.1 PREDICTED: uncharacterized protein LOC105321272 [Crassostrea gigas]